MTSTNKRIDHSNLVNDQAVESNMDHFADCNEFNENEDVVKLSPRKCSHCSIIDDEAEEMKPSPPQKET